MRLTSSSSEFWMATDAKSDGKAAQDGRPTAFEAKAGSGYVLITFQRVKS